MEARISDITTSHILVTFDNDSRAHVAIEKGWDQDRILEEISKYIPLKVEITPFDNLDDVPLSVGQSFDVEPYSTLINRKNEEALEKSQEDLKKIEEEQKRLREDRVLDYTEMRMYAYPTMQEQLDALYWSRVGVATYLEDIDRRIASVKETYPKGEQRTWKEYSESKDSSKSFFNPVKDNSRMISIDGESVEITEDILRSWKDYSGEGN